MELCFVPSGQTKISARQQPLIAQLVSNSADTLDNVLRDLMETHDAVSATSGAVMDGSAFGAGEGASSAGSLSDGGSLATKALSDAVHHENFLYAITDCEGKAGVDRLDICFAARSIILLRFILENAPWLRHRHDFFIELAPDLDARLAYLSRVLALDVDTQQVPGHLASWRWSPAALALFSKGKWDEIDWVNAPSGFLDLDYADNGGSVSYVVASERYTLQPSLEGIKKFLGRLFVALGFPDTCATGWTFNNVVDTQMAMSKYTAALPTEMAADWSEKLNNRFREALARAGQHFITVLHSGKPATASLHEWLPEGADYFSLMLADQAAAEPLKLMQRAFPSAFQTAIRSLPGATRPTLLPSLAAGSNTGADSSTGGGEATRTPAGSGKRKGPVADEPGAKASLVRVLNGGKFLFLAGMIYDLDAICTMWELQRDEYCWPVLLSSKPGVAALALCPAHDTHGGITAKCHKQPPGFDRAAARKHPYAEQATQVQKDSFGYVYSKPKQGKK